jgi:hypothetical protein
VEYYPVIRNAMMQINLEGIMLREVSSHKRTAREGASRKSLQQANSEEESRCAVTRTGRGRTGSNCLMDEKFLFGLMESSRNSNDD